MKINIRLATLDDAMICADIHARSWAFAYSDIVPKDIIDAHNARWPMIWRKMLVNNTNSHYVVVCNGTIIGFLTIEASRDDDLEALFCEIIGLYLDPEHIGAGYGKQAMDWIKKETQRREYSQLSLWVLEENTRAIRFYEKAGFTADGKIKPSGLAHTQELRYICELDI